MVNSPRRELPSTQLLRCQRSLSGGRQPAEGRPLDASIQHPGASAPAVITHQSPGELLLGCKGIKESRQSEAG